jgi:hypothetical protein
LSHGALHPPNSELLEICNPEIWSLNQSGFADLIGTNIVLVLNFPNAGNLGPNFFLSALVLLHWAWLGYPNYELEFFINIRVRH